MFLVKAYILQELLLLGDSQCNGFVPIYHLSMSATNVEELVSNIIHLYGDILMMIIITVAATTTIFPCESSFLLLFAVVIQQLYCLLLGRTIAAIIQSFL